MPSGYNHAEALSVANSAIQIPAMPTSFAHYFRKRGHQKCYLALYSCKPQDVLKRVLTEAVKYTLHKDGVADLLLFREKVNVMSPEVQAHFIDGAYTFIQSRESRPLQGSYIAFGSPVIDENTAVDQSAPSAVAACAALSSLMHGEFVATECHYAATYDLVTGEVFTDSSAITVRQTAEHEPLNQGIAKIFDELFNSDFARQPVALALISRSHHEADPTIKFLYLWLAIEAAIGDGRARHHFAKTVMKSEALDRAIQAIRKKRDAILHEGDMVGLDHKEYLRAKCVFLMGLSRNPVLRDRLLKYLQSELGCT